MKKLYLFALLLLALPLHAQTTVTIAGQLTAPINLTLTFSGN